LKIYSGIPGAPGISEGIVFYLNKNSNSTVKIGINEAVEKAKNIICELIVKAKEKTGDENAKIFEAYKMLLEDNAYILPIIESINEGVSPDKAVINHTESTAAIFEKHKSEYMKQRADDVRYIGNLLIDCLKENETDFTFPENKKIILVSEELTPADTIQMDKRNIVGFVTAKGGATSHTVILAKSLGIPAVVGVIGINSSVNDTIAIIDATKGKLIVEPDGETIIHYNKLTEKDQEIKVKLESISNAPAKTSDGERIYIYGNIGGINDITTDNVKTIDGIGLFRSEFLYSSSRTKPLPEVQVLSYKSVLDIMNPKPVTIRTLDIGGDKKLDYMNMPFEENPFLGNRGIRLCLMNKEIFKEQLKSIMISASGKGVKILLPMITEAEEIETAKSIINEVKETVPEECRNNISVGIMIETPASAINAENLAKHCDFFSIGTNDLIQYVTAADRGNDYVSKLYTPYNPAVLKLIYHVIKSADENNIDISMCGDMASDESVTALLLGLGLRKFSVPLPLVSKIKYQISKINLNESKELADNVLKLGKKSEIKKLIDKFNEKLEH